MIDDRNKLIMIHIPRTGGTTIEKMSGFSIHNERPDKHWSGKEIYDRIGVGRWSSYFKFSIIRHPAERMRSVYNWITKPSVGHWAYTELSFIDWLKFIYAERPAGNPYKSMCDFLDFECSDISLYKYEEDYQDIAELYGCKNIPYVAHKTSRPEITVEERAIIYSIHTRDYDRFGYEA